MDFVGSALLAYFVYPPSFQFLGCKFVWLIHFICVEFIISSRLKLFRRSNKLSLLNARDAYKLWMYRKFVDASKLCHCHSLKNPPCPV